MSDTANRPCKTCTHPFKDHCKGRQFHSNYKDAMRQAKNPRQHQCHGPHCLEPLCSCVVFEP